MARIKVNVRLSEAGIIGADALAKEVGTTRSDIVRYALAFAFAQKADFLKYVAAKMEGRQ